MTSRRRRPMDSWRPTPQPPPPPPPPAQTPRPAWRRLLRKAWPTIRILVGFGLVVVALWVLSSKDSELSGFTSVLDHLNWWWVPPAFAVEIGSYVAFAAMQWNLLMAGHLRPPVVDAAQADLRLPGAHQLAAHRQRRGHGLRLPLVPPLRGRQHARRLGPGRNAGRRGGEPLAGRRHRFGAGHQPGRLLRPGARAHRRLRRRRWPSARSLSTSARCTLCSPSGSPSR